MANVFILSPGRTATTSLAMVFKRLEGYTSGHETQSQLLGDSRVRFPENHIECDNRLCWFLERLTRFYGSSGILVIVHRDEDKIAKSYNQRWYKINIMRAYSQGILQRPLTDNNLSVCADYVSHMYEKLNFWETQWNHVVHLDLAAPELGLSQLLGLLSRESDMEDLLRALNETRSNENLSGFRFKLSNLVFNLKLVLTDLTR